MYILICIIIAYYDICAHLHILYIHIIYIYTIGDIEEIERADGQTLDIVDESGGGDNSSSSVVTYSLLIYTNVYYILLYISYITGDNSSSVVTYPLDEALISFSSAIDSGDQGRAMVILDPLQVCMRCSVYIVCGVHVFECSICLHSLNPILHNIYIRTYTMQCGIFTAFLLYYSYTCIYIIYTHIRLYKHYTCTLYIYPYAYTTGVPGCGGHVATTVPPRAGPRRSYHRYKSS